MLPHRGLLPGIADNLERVQVKLGDRPAPTGDPRDMAAVFISRWSLPAIVLCVGAMIYSASGDNISGDAIGIVSALITSTVMGLMGVLRNMRPEREEPMTIVAQELITGLQRSEARTAALTEALIAHIRRPHSTLLNLDDNSISMVDGDTRAVVGKPSEPSDPCGP